MKNPTPRVKAQELINKFASYTDIKNEVGHVDHDSFQERNKKCALIVVGEILDTVCPNDQSEEQMANNESAYYWQHVKEEIELNN